MKKGVISFLIVILITSLCINSAFAFSGTTETQQTVDVGIDTSSEVEGDDENTEISEQTDEKIIFKDKNLELVIRAKIRKISGDILQSDVENISSLVARNKAITTLDGIENLTNLHNLDLFDNQIKNIEPLNGLTNLVSLDLGYNNIRNIDSLNSLAKLTNLELAGNNIEGLDPLGELVNLETLNLNNNSIGDISPLEPLIKLKNLYLDSNLIEDISTLITMSNNGGLRSSKIDLRNNLLSLSQEEQDVKDIHILSNKEISITYVPQRELINVSDVKIKHENLILSLSQSYSLHADVSPYDATNRNVTWESSDESVATVDDSGLVTAVSEGETLITVTTKDGEKKATCKVVVFSNDVVNFPDPNLESLVREQLPKGTEEILKSDLIDIKYLGGDSRKISSLQGIENLVNLENLYISYNLIEDISPLENLTKLNNLVLRNNRVKDISPLKKLTKLDNLVLSNNKIKDISPLEGLSNLNVLDLEGNNIENIDPLEIISDNGGLNSRVHLADNYIDITEESDNLRIIEKIIKQGADYVHYQYQKTRVTGVEIETDYGSISTLGLIKDTFETKGLKAKVLSSSGNANRNVYWESSTPEVATVDQNGNVKAVSEGNATITVTTEDGSFQDSIEITVFEDYDIKFSDHNLENQIRHIIGKITGEISKRDILPIESLYLSYHDFNNLEGLEHFTNLQSLYLQRTNIKDGSILKNISNLSTLNLRDNQISDINFLTELKNLSWLGLSNNNISDLSSLTFNSNLSYLDLSNNRIRSISPLVQNSTDIRFSNGLNLDLSNNYLDISKQSQNAKDIQVLLDKGIKVTYLPQRTPGPETEPVNVYSVVIDNSYGARPQNGINSAELVYELPVAPSITRYLALYDASQNVGKIGPVRSARKSLAEIAAGYGGAFVHAGGSKESLKLIPSLPIINFDEIYGSGAYFYRTEDRVAPHNLYTDSSLLEKGLENRNRYTTDSPTSILPVGDTTGGAEANKAVTKFKGSSYNTEFRWENDQYVKYENNKKVITQEGLPIGVDNVIQIYVPHKQYFDKEWLIEVDMIGSGPARFYRDGKVWDGYWEKTSAKDPVNFYLEDQTQMLFKEGKAWVLVDESLSIDHMDPAQGQDDVLVDSDMTIEFNEDIQEGNKYGEVQLLDAFDNPVKIVKSIDGKALIIKPEQQLEFNQHYKLMIPEGAVTNSRGMVNKGTTVTFKTKWPHDAVLQLNKGWNLISVPQWVDEFTIEEEDVDAWISHGVKDGATNWLSDREDVVAQLNNPASAVYIKANKSTPIYFNWKTNLSPYETFASKTLSMGWNLIGAGSESYLKDVLSDMRYVDGNGLTRIYAPSTFNNNKQPRSNYNWPTNILDLTEWRPNYKMNPYDGYWVYLKGDEEVYTTIVDEK